MDKVSQTLVVAGSHFNPNRGHWSSCEITALIKESQGCIGLRAHKFFTISYSFIGMVGSTFI